MNGRDKLCLMMTASEMAKKRWLNVSAAERSAHARKAVEAREQKRARERASEASRIPESIAREFEFAARMHQHERYAYARLGYRFGLRHLVDQAARERAIRSLKEKGQIVGARAFVPRYKIPEWEKATLSALQAPLLDKLALDRAKLVNWNDRNAPAALRAIFKDPGIAALIPRAHAHGFLSGLRAGALGEALRYQLARQKIG